jgi:hypothetical protein
MKKLFDRQLTAATVLSKNHPRERLEAVYQKMIEVYSEFDGAEITAAIVRIRQDIVNERERLALLEQLSQAKLLLEQANDRLRNE